MSPEVQRNGKVPVYPATCVSDDRMTAVGSHVPLSRTPICRHLCFTCGEPFRGRSCNDTCQANTVNHFFLLSDPACIESAKSTFETARSLVFRLACLQKLSLSLSLLKPRCAYTIYWPVSPLEVHCGCSTVRRGEKEISTGSITMRSLSSIQSCESSLTSSNPQLPREDLRCFNPFFKPSHRLNGAAWSVASLLPTCSTPTL